MDKVLVVLITKDFVEHACMRAILDQDYGNYSTMIHILKPFKIHEEETRNRMANLVVNRNQARILALASNADKFLFVDSDVVLPPYAITKLVGFDLDIVAGWYRKIDGSNWVAGHVSEAYEFKFVQPTESLLEVDMVGMGCAMFSRKCLEKITISDGLNEGVRHPNGSITLLGECLATTYQAKNKGFKAYMTSDVICEHLIRR